MKLNSIFVLLVLTGFGCDSMTRQTSNRDDTAVDVRDNTALGTSDRIDRDITALGTRNGTDPDNTAVNTRDRSNQAKTPLNQGQNQKDIDITANIRKQVMESEMSLNAQNVKIITEEGSVTLRGPVATADEKQKIEMIAHKVAGEKNVNSQLEIARSN